MMGRCTKIIRMVAIKGSSSFWGDVVKPDLIQCSLRGGADMRSLVDAKLGAWGRELPHFREWSDEGWRARKRDKREKEEEEARRRRGNGSGISPMERG